MPIALDSRAVTVKAGFKALVSSVTFKAYPGQVLAILGPSGAGKSTLFRALNGVREPDGGKVFYGDSNLYESYDKFRMQIGFVPQDDILHDSLCPGDVLYYAGRLRLPESTSDEEIHTRVDEVLSLVELTERKRVRVKQLSGGQRKRVNLGVELMMRPPVLFLDEPTSGLDPALEEKMMDLFQQLARRGSRTVLLTTHITDSLDRVDRVLLLCRGKLTYIGKPARALQFFGVKDFGDIYTRLTTDGADHWAGMFKSSGLAERDAAEAPRITAGTQGTATPRIDPKTPITLDTTEALLAQLEAEMEEKRRP